MSSSIIVFSHLRWDFVYQRPQHLLSRLANHFRIVFIEEPLTHEQSFMKSYSPAPNIQVLQPHTPVDMPGFHDDHLPYLKKLLREVVQDHEDHLVWFYTPMALPLLQELKPRLVVYDCMDELASFKNAPKQLLQRESALLKVADIVFTGGRSLHRSKRDRHPNVHCFPSSVDASHFEQALDRSNTHPAHRTIPGPRLGFYGVIDERFDTTLIGKVADAHPMWQIVLVGPVVKIDPATLPQRPNIHYLGQQSYESLPQFLAGWNVCLLPFALNEATQFISPTKTLEYMAAELPIVSTPVADVAEAYSDVVAIAPDASSFIKACESALLASPEEQAEQVEKMRKVLASTSWDSTVQQMLDLLHATPRQQRTSPVAAEPAEKAEVITATSINRLRQVEATRFAKTAIIGAGPTGLSAAYHLGHDAVLLERNDMVGGSCRSVRQQGFTFDSPGHVMFSRDPYVLELYEMLLGSNLHWQDGAACVFSRSVYTSYPFQRSLHGLPPEIIKDCLLGAIKAHGHPDTRGSAIIPGQDNRTIAGEAVNDLPSNVAPLEKPRPSNFEEFIEATLGDGIARHFALPYYRKFWAVPLTEMEASRTEDGRLPMPTLEEMIDGALRPAPVQADPGSRFAYPLRGGFQALMSGFVPHIKGTIELNADVVQLAPREHVLTLRDGRHFEYEHLISTIPLPLLIKMTGDEAPEEVRRAAASLKHISIRCVNLGIARANITDKHWIYYPEDSLFHRIFAQGNASPECSPPGSFGLTCEISYSSPWKPLPAEGQELIDRCIRDCIKVGLLKEDDKIITASEVDMPYAYVVYDHDRAKNVEVIKSWLSMHDIVPAGRYGEWEYHISDHAFLAGKRAAEAVKWMETNNAVAVE